MLTHLSLCSGIGGLDLAAESAGFVTIGQCEYADYQTKVLERHWPDVPRWRDIRTLNGENFYDRTGQRTVDVISGGIPCQPFSVAGKRRSKEDDRYLWPEMFRVIQELCPLWVVVENVTGIINLALNQVLSDLESIGYEGQTFVIPACGVDAPHKRERVCIVAHAVNGSSVMRRHWKLQNAKEDGRERSDNGRRTETVFTGERRENESPTSGMADGLRTAVYEANSNSDLNGLQRRCSKQIFRGGDYDSVLRSFLELTPRGKIGLMNPNWIEWLMGYPIGWTELNV